MRGPPPEMRRAATRQSDSPKSQSNSLPCAENNKRDALDDQAEKLRRLYSFCRATAYTMARIAFAGVPAMSIHSNINSHDHIAWGPNGRASDAPITDGGEPNPLEGARPGDGLTAGPGQTCRAKT